MNEDKSILRQMNRLELAAAGSLVLGKIMGILSAIFIMMMLSDRGWKTAATICLLGAGTLIAACVLLCIVSWQRYRANT